MSEQIGRGGGAIEQTTEKVWLSAAGKTTCHFPVKRTQIDQLACYVVTFRLPNTTATVTSHPQYPDTQNGDSALCFSV